MLLHIELVPSSCWYSNVRSEVSRATWDMIRKHCYQQAAYRCEICGETGLQQGYRHPIECHEIWEYQSGVQQLKGFIALCPLCHEVKHAGLTISRKGWEGILGRLMSVNTWTRNAAVDHVVEAFEQWERRSVRQWVLDISLLDHYIGSLTDTGFKPTAPPCAAAGIPRNQE